MLAFIIALAALLRFVHLGTKSIWSDEAFSIYMAQLPWTGFWHLLTTSEANMAIYYVLLRPWLQFGDAAWWVRLLSALMGVAVVPVVYWLGKEVLSRRAGLIAALLLAINPFDIRYSQEARSYSLVVLLVVISFWSFFHCLWQRDDRWAAVYVLSSALALYAHFFAALALVTQIASLLLMPRDDRPFAIRQAARTGFVFLLGLPLAAFVQFRNTGQLNWAPPVHAIDFYHFLLFLTGSGVKFAIALIAVAVSLKMWVSRIRVHPWSMEEWKVLVLILWLLLPIAATLVVSIWKPVYAPRFLLFCLPAALLLIGNGLAQISHPWARYALITVFVIASLGPIRAYYAEVGQEDWKATVRFLTQNAHPGDIAWLPNAYCALPLSYAIRHANGAFPELQVVSSVPAEKTPQPGTIWMISCSATKSFKASSAATYSVEKVAEFNGIRVLRLK